MSADSKPKARKARAHAVEPSTNGKRETLARDLAAEFEAVRTALDEMTEHYHLRLGAQIAELLDLVRGAPALERASKGLPATVTQAMLERLRNARLKPAKGRAKDFVRLQELLDELTRLLPPER